MTPIIFNESTLLSKCIRKIYAICPSLFTRNNIYKNFLISQLQLISIFPSSLYSNAINIMLVNATRAFPSFYDKIFHNVMLSIMKVRFGNYIIMSVFFQLINIM